MYRILQVNRAANQVDADHIRATPNASALDTSISRYEVVALCGVDDGIVG